MKSPVVINLYVNNAASTASKPGEQTSVLRLQLPPKSDRVDDENLGVFADADRKSTLMEIQGLNGDFHSQFKGGQRVKVTIEVIETVG